MPAASTAERGPAVVAETRPEAAEWDAFVLAQESSGVFHLSAWARILRCAYGFEPRYLAAREDGRLTGVLPVAQTYGLVSGKRIRSLPVVDPAGPLATGPATERALVEAVCRMTDAAGARSLNLQATRPGYEQIVPGLGVLSESKTYIAPLPEDAEELRRGWKKTRNNLWRSLRKADAGGIAVRRGESAADMRAFHHLYRDTMRRHRSLPHSLRFFEAIRTTLPESARMLVLAEHEGRAIAGALFYMHRDILYLAYNGSLQSRFDLRPNHAVYWHAIRHGIEHGLRRYDMGAAVPGQSLARFKEQWGGEPVGRWHYMYAPGRDGPGAALALRSVSNALDAQDGSESLAARVWDRLPLPVTSAAGSVMFRFF